MVSVSMATTKHRTKTLKYEQIIKYVEKIDAYQKRILLSLKQLITLNFALIWQSECQSIIFQIALLTLFIVKFEVFLIIKLIL